MHSRKAIRTVASLLHIATASARIGAKEHAFQRIASIGRFRTERGRLVFTTLPRVEELVVIGLGAVAIVHVHIRRRSILVWY